MKKHCFDFSGLLCPLPVLKARKRLKDVQIGEIMEIITTDQGAVKDFQAFCEVDEHICLLAQIADGQAMIHRIKKIQ